LLVEEDDGGDEFAEDGEGEEYAGEEEEAE